MSSRKTSIRNIAVGVVAGGAVLAAVVWMYPPAREALMSVRPYYAETASSLQPHLLTGIFMPFWVLCLLVLLSLPAIYLAAGYIFRLFMRHVLKKEHSPYVLYRSDRFYGIPWTWKYSSQREPVNVWCECPECRATLVYEYSSHRGEVTVHCESCDRDLNTFEGNIDYLKAKTSRLIEVKIKSGEWEEAVKSGEKGKE